MSKSTIFNTKLTNVVQLFNDADLDVESGYLKEALAAIGVNPTMTWIKFDLTDNLPNANKQRIPISEFTNLIKSGVFMPIKKAWYKISEGHDETYPLGVITNLKQVKDSDDVEKITGIAGLWSRERPQDIDELKAMAADGQPIDLSWEIFYEDSTLDDNGIEDLHGTSLRATTIVGNPAYGGRTRITAMAAKDSGSTPATNMEDNTLEELEQLKIKLADLEDKFKEAETNLIQTKSEKEALEAELAELRKFKSEIETTKANEEKILAIKSKFKDSGVDKPEEYFVEKKDFLLGLSDETLDFMLQELVSFKSEIPETETSETHSTKVPRLTGEGAVGKISAKDLVDYLKKSRKN